MRERFLKPLGAIAKVCEALLAAQTLNVAQERMIQAIIMAAQTMADSIISFPDEPLEQSSAVLSYETRSHLASIIGYAEALLDGTEGVLTEPQAEQILMIRAYGKQLINTLARIVSSAE